MEVFVTHWPDLHVRSAAAAENSEVIPEVLHTFFRDDGRVPSHLVVDSTVQGLCAGGIRMVPEMPLADLNIFGLQQQVDLAFIRRLVEATDASCIFVRDSGDESAMA